MHRIGTAGWSVPGKLKSEGTHLHRYSQALTCVEVNSSFYRSHRAATWRKWNEETPEGFRFSIKAPKAITHTARLLNTQPLLNAFFEEIRPLGEKRGPIFFQLPPSLKFDSKVAEEFLATLRKLYQAEAVLEPRHSSWFNADANALLQKYKISRVAADPPQGAVEASEPAGDTDFVYYRLHGSPRLYYSSYDHDYLAALAAKLASQKHSWVIFDNTASASAYENALELQAIANQRALETNTSQPLSASGARDREI